VNLDCTTCGACCTLKVKRLPGETWPKGWPVKRRVIQKEEFEPCPFLEGCIGQKVHCTVYDQRPQVCRQFEAGSEVCLLAREILGGLSDVSVFD
jgi:Fe-S-cluster containining protein